MGRPKALLEYRGETFLDRIVRLLGAECAPVIAVLGDHSQAVRAGAVSRNLEFVINPDPGRGQLSSLQCGVERARNASGVLFTPVDLPAIDGATVAGLAGALRAGALLAIPRYQGRHGHPAGISRALFEELLALPSTGSAKELIKRYASQIVYVDVDNPGVVHDIDTPEEYRNLPEGAEP